MFARIDINNRLWNWNAVITLLPQDAIDQAPDKRLDETRVKFYAAEISLALMYLHDNKLMYR